MICSRRYAQPIQSGCAARARRRRSLVSRTVRPNTRWAGPDTRASACCARFPEWARAARGVVGEGGRTGQSVKPAKPFARPDSPSASAFSWNSENEIALPVRAAGTRASVDRVAMVPLLRSSAPPARARARSECMAMRFIGTYCHHRRRPAQLGAAAPSSPPSDPPRRSRAGRVGRTPQPRLRATRPA